MSFGGARTERKALDGLLRAHEEALRDVAYRAAALRIVMRSQGREPIGGEKPS
jgi:hypothetical protein